MAELFATAENEDTANEIIKLYNTYLGRDPLQGGLDGWLATGQSIEQIEQGIANSPEAAVFQTFNETVGRDPTMEERDFYVNVNPAPIEIVEQVLSGTQEAQEFQTQQQLDETDMLADTTADDTTADDAADDTPAAATKDTYTVITSNAKGDASSPFGGTAESNQTAQLVEMTEQELRQEFEDSGQLQQQFGSFDNYMGYINDSQEWVQSADWMLANPDYRPSDIESAVIEGEDLAFRPGEKEEVTEKISQDISNARQSGYQQWMNEGAAILQKWGIQDTIYNDDGDQFKWTGSGYQKTIKVDDHASFSDYLKVALETAVVSALTGAAVSTIGSALQGTAVGNAIGQGTQAVKGALETALAAVPGINGANAATIAEFFFPTVQSGGFLGSGATSDPFGLLAGVGGASAGAATGANALENITEAVNSAMSSNIIVNLAGTDFDDVQQPAGIKNDDGTTTYDAFNLPVGYILNTARNVVIDEASGIEYPIVPGMYGARVTLPPKVSEAEAGGGGDTAAGADGADGADGGDAGGAEPATTVTVDPSAGATTTDQGQYEYIGNGQFRDRVDGDIFQIPGDWESVVSDQGIGTGDFVDEQVLVDINVRGVEAPIDSKGVATQGTAATEKSDVVKAAEWILVNLPNYRDMTEVEINKALESAGLEPVDMNNDGTISSKSEVVTTADGNQTSTVTVTGGNGNNTLTGGNGNNTLTGGNGNNTLDGGDGNDTLNGGDGNDTLKGGNGNDTVTVIGGNGNNTISGGNGNDAVVGKVSTGGLGDGKGAGDGDGDGNGDGLGKAGLFGALAALPTIAQQQDDPFSKFDIRIQAEAVPEAQIKLEDPVAQLRRLAFAPHGDKPSGMALDGLLTSLGKGVA